jgi:homoaconitase
MNFLASPTIVTAMAFSGKLSFNPVTDSLKLPSGESFKFNPPSGQDLPSSGFALGDISYQPTPVPDPQPETEVIIRKDSQRLEALEAFPSHFTEGSILELPQMKVLMRVRGKCTTDHISAAVSLSPSIVNVSRLSISSTRDLGSSIRGTCLISLRISVSCFP